MTTHELAELLLAREDMPAFFFNQMYEYIDGGKNVLTEPIVDVDDDDEFGPAT